MYYNCIKLNRLVECLPQRGKHFFWSREKNVWTGSFSFFSGFFLWKCSVFFHAFFNISIKYELIKGNVVMLFFHCPSFVRSDGIACSIKTSADVVRPRPKQDIGRALNATWKIHLFVASQQTSSVMCNYGISFIFPVVTTIYIFFVIICFYHHILYPIKNKCKNSKRIPKLATCNILFLRI